MFTSTIRIQVFSSIEVTHSPITSKEYCSIASTGDGDAAEVIGGLCGTEAVAERLSEPAVKTDLGPQK